MSYKILCWLLVITAYIALIGGEGIPQSPCPEFFSYELKENEPGKLYGTVTLLNQTNEAGVWLKLSFDRPSLQLGNWFGEVLTQDNKEYLIKSRNTVLKANVPTIIRFFIKYDTNETIPLLTGIRLNGKNICPVTIDR